MFLKRVGGSGAEFFQFLVANPSGNIGASLHGQQGECLQSGVNYLIVFCGWPIQEAATIEVLLSIRNLGCNLWNQLFEISLLLLQIGQVTLVQIVVPVKNDPPERVGGDAVHPSGQGSG